MAPTRSVCAGRPLLTLGLALAWVVGLFAGPTVLAVDPPHTTNVDCGSCHMPHQAQSGTLATVAGTANLCISCHSSGGLATSSPLSIADQAAHWLGLPAGTAASGSSHRWDSSVSGRVAAVGTPTSTGTITPGGLYTGTYSKTFVITISTGGAVGTARFGWTATTPAGTTSGTSVLTGADVPLDGGTTVTFANGATGTSFVAGDKWNVIVHVGMKQPSNAAMTAFIKNGVADCSSCHDPHTQAKTPFDPAAPAYTGRGAGSGRHFLRTDNNSGQICMECHDSGRYVVSDSIAGVHPVGITVTADSTHTAPSSLPLTKGTGTIGCLTCHAVHHSPVADGKLLRQNASVQVCTQCHSQSDMTGTPAHFVASDPHMLWPTGNQGSTMPARGSADQGSCLNCHTIHGWPSATDAAQKKALLVETKAKLCITCHGTTGPATKTVAAEAAKARGHMNASATSQGVTCQDCHNPHKGQQGIRSYTATATATRNTVSNPMKGVSGVAVNFTGLANFDAPSFAAYSVVTSSTLEYQVCLKCHSGFGGSTSRAGQSPNGTAANPLETDLAQEFSPANKSGHPIVTGLDNYPNSTAVGGKKGLLVGAMKAPWTNVGQQTMSCLDCHNTDAVSTAAQGPHGSASQFMLRGPNAANWPNVPLTSFNSSWCANCHNNAAGDPHGEGGHASAQCWVCHIVVPHGGKMSRLVADHDTMPARYAQNSTRNPEALRSYTKRAIDQYQAGNCLASCHGLVPDNSPHTATNPTENW